MITNLEGLRRHGMITCTIWIFLIRPVQLNSLLLHPCMPQLEQVKVNLQRLPHSPNLLQRQRRIDRSFCHLRESVLCVDKRCLFWQSYCDDKEVYDDIVVYANSAALAENVETPEDSCADATPEYDTVTDT